MHYEGQVTIKPIKTKKQKQELDFISCKHDFTVSEFTKNDGKDERCVLVGQHEFQHILQEKMHAFLKVLAEGGFTAYRYSIKLNILNIRLPV